MPTIFLQAGGTNAGAVSGADILRGLAQFQARVALDAATVLTDSSGGTADSGYAVAQVAADATNVANSGTSLAQKTAGEAAMITVLDAVKELYAKANEAAALVGIPTITYNGGGATVDGTVAAVTVAVTAATTGIPATAFNTFVTGVNEAIYNVGLLTNKLATAAGKTGLTFNYKGTPVSTVAAISTSTGTAADPGVTKAIADARLTSFRTNIATVTNRLNAVLAGPGAATVVAA